MKPPGARLVVSCEHAGNRVPAGFAAPFHGAEAVVAGHRGWDPGALRVAHALARAFDAPLRYSLTTRLLVDPNRSEGAPDLFSEFTRDLPARGRRRILRRHHRRVRRRVEVMVRRAIGREPAGPPVLHLGVHTFSPVWKGRPRDVDLGVLFDPGREREAAFARAWVRELAMRLPGLRVRENEPYLGADDGLTTTLRRVFPEEAYLGIELEVRQDLATERSGPEREMRTAVVEALMEALSGERPPCGAPTPPAGVPTRSR